MRKGLLLFACLGVSVLAGAAPTKKASQRFDISNRFSRVSSEALKSLKASVGKPFTAGYVFIDGRYIPPPYKVERYGTALRINGYQITNEIVPWQEFLKTQPAENLKVEERTVTRKVRPKPVAPPPVATEASTPQVESDPPPAAPARKTTVATRLDDSFSMGELEFPEDVFSEADAASIFEDISGAASVKTEVAAAKPAPAPAPIAAPAPVAEAAPVVEQPTPPPAPVAETASGTEITTASTETPAAAKTAVVAETTEEPKAETAAAPSEGTSAATPAQAQEISDAEALAMLDSLFDDETSAATPSTAPATASPTVAAEVSSSAAPVAPSAPSATPAAAEPAAEEVVTRVVKRLSLAGAFVPNEKSAPLLQKLNAARTRLDAELRKGGYFFFSVDYSPIAGDAGTAKLLIGKLPEVQRDNPEYEAFVKALFEANLGYLPRPLQQSLFANRHDYPSLLNRRKTDEERAAWEKKFGPIED